MFHIPCWWTRGVLLHYLLFVRERGTRDCGGLLAGGLPTRSLEGWGTELRSLEIVSALQCIRKRVYVLHSVGSTCRLYLSLLWCYELVSSMYANTGK